MIEAAGITLREAIEAILVIFIMAAYLEKAGEPGKKRYVYGGALAAVGTSVALAVGLTQLGIEPENELVEGALFLLAAVLVGSLVVWMNRKSRTIKRDIETKIESTASVWGLASVAFVMVFREGIETVIFLQSLVLAGSSGLSNLAGALVGIGLAVAFGAVFLRGSARINLSRFFKVTSGILGVLVVVLLGSGLHEFFEVGLLPSNDAVMLFVGYLTKDSTGSAVIAFMLIALMLTAIYDVFKAERPDLSTLTDAERREARYEHLKEKYTKIGFGAVLTVAILLVLAPTIAASDVSVDTPTEVEANGGVIEVTPPAEDGVYRYTYDGARFLVAVEDDSVKVALDDCEVCPPKGYGYDAEEGVLVCLNCGAPINHGTVGESGGCNPKPLNHTVEDGTVRVQVQELTSGW